MRTAALALLLVTSSLAGCIGQQTPPIQSTQTDPTSPSPDQGPPTGSPNGSASVLNGCQGACFEPSTAWTPDGDLLVAEYAGETIAKAANGTGNVTHVAPPPLPENAAGRIDSLLTTDPAGRLWFSTFLAGSGSEAGHNAHIQVARSDDGGQTWTVDRVLTMGISQDPTDVSSQVDRQWLVFASPDRAYLLCNCPVGVSTILRVTEDGGQTWSQPEPILATRARSPPVGRPAVGPNDTIVAPYFLAPPAASEGADASLNVGSTGVAAAVSSNGGEDWRPVLVEADPTTTTGGFAFPVATAGPKGTFSIGWQDDDGRALVAQSSAPGQRWEEPVQISPDEAVGFYPHVWLETTTNGTLVASWYADLDGDPTILTGWGSPGEAFHVEPLGDAAGFPGDHAHVSVAPDGRIAVPWTTPNRNAVQAQVLSPLG